MDIEPIISEGIAPIGSLLGGALTQSYNRENMALQSEYAKDLMSYQWHNFNSYEAQVRSMIAAGLNPSVLFGHGSSQAASPSVNMPSSAPVQIPNVFDMSSMSNMISSVAQAKKAGMDTKLAEQDIKNKEIERQLSEFELSLKKQFGKDFKSVELANAYRQLLLASDSHDLNEQEKALNDWRLSIAKSESTIKESEREIVRQRLENNPTAIRLENQLLAEKAKTEKAQQAVSYSQAEVNRESRRINAALADIEESGKTEKIKALIADYQARGLISRKDAEEARLMAQRLHDNNELRGDSLWRGIDDILDYLKDKVSIFK